MDSKSIHSLPVVVDTGLVGVLDYLEVLKLFYSEKITSGICWLDFLNKSLQNFGFNDACLTHSPSIDTSLREALDKLGTPSLTTSYFTCFCY
jgi:hypothetical protein